ncbi:3-oxoacyl-[acyl-carrier-protein] synthase III C-terminal domain-containing protein [Cohnella soli]|uniref:3-oxoacyl-[acyl-carrier-protein] synthase III C-terminal domain-containing protein n=1 Tax=Cohnella soli TaxID=425005 RepID=A0ABW0I222_9BACL
MLFRTLDATFSPPYRDRRHIQAILLTYRYCTFPYWMDLPRRIQSRYRLSPNVNGYAITDLTCSNNAKIFEVASILLSRSADERATVLCIAVDMEIEDSERGGDDFFVIGDAAAAFVLGLRGPGDRILAFDDKSDTRHIRLDSEFKNQGFVAGPNYFLTLIKVLERTVKAAGLSFEDIDLFIPHNASEETMKVAANLMKVPIEKFFFEGMSSVGHCGNSDLFINYSLAVRSGKIKANDYYMFISIGLGGGISCVVCRKA